jgi:ABC-type Mn2+/Zn2+ transport system permease subunit
VNFLSDFWNYEFLRMALLGTLGLSIITGLMAPVIVGKRYAFIGASISHSSLLGVALGLSLFGENNPWGLFSIILLTTSILVSFLAYSTYRQRLPSDSLIGVFFTTTMGLGMLVHGRWGQNQGDLLNYLFGNVLLLLREDIILIAFLCLAIFAFLIPQKDKWLFYLTDEEAALAGGLPCARYHFTLYFILTIIIVAGLKIAGAVLINTLLIIPGLFALKWGNNLKQVFIYSISFSFLTSLIALILSNALSLPIGPALALFQFICLALSMLVKKYQSA